MTEETIIKNIQAHASELKKWSDELAKLKSGGKAKDTKRRSKVTDADMAAYNAKRFKDFK